MGFHLGQAYPNPFNPVTTLPFEMVETGMARLSIHNLLGAEVAVLWNGMAERGRHEVTFDASTLPSGVYVATLKAEAGSRTSKLLLIK